MGKLKGHRPSPALLVAVVALVAALSGGAVAGVAVTSLSKKDKKQVKKISKKQAKKLDKKIELKPGPPGEDATNLFAYIRDNGSGSTAELDYGEGATGVSDPPGDNNGGDPYVVNFNRDLTGCVAHSTTGLGEPDRAPDLQATTGPMFADVEGSSVETFAVSATSGTTRDTSFVISVFC